MTLPAGFKSPVSPVQACHLNKDRRLHHATRMALHYNPMMHPALLSKITGSLSQQSRDPCYSKIQHVIMCWRQHGYDSSACQSAVKLMQECSNQVQGNKKVSVDSVINKVVQYFKEHP